MLSLLWRAEYEHGHVGICTDSRLCRLKQRLGLPLSLNTILRILATSLFEKTPVQLVFQRFDDETSERPDCIQLKLFDI